MEIVDRLGSCGLAPVAVVDERVHGRFNAESPGGAVAGSGLGRWVCLD